MNTHDMICRNLSRILTHCLFLMSLATWCVAAPNPPLGCTAAATLNIIPTNATIQISWIDNSTDEVSWRVGYRVDQEANFQWLAAATDSTTRASVGSTVSTSWPSAQLDRNYEFFVVALDASGGSAASNTARVRTEALGAPFNFQVTAVDPFNVVFSWDEASTTESGFSIERKVGSGPWTILSPAIAANVLSTPITPYIEPSTSYSFRIRAYTGGAPTTPDSSTGSTAVSLYSPVFTLTSAAYTLAANAVPGQTRVNLAWTDVYNEAGYQVLMRASGGFFFSIVATLPANATSYQVTPPLIEPGRGYEFAIWPVTSSAILGSSTIAAALVDGITSIAGATGLPGSAFTHSFTHVSNAGVTSRSLTGVPSGLTFTSGSGVLSGVCPPPGVYVMNYTLNLSNGATLTQSFALRVRPPVGPPALSAAIPAWNGLAGTQRSTPLAGVFTDAEAESAVRVSTTVGDMDFILFNTATPATVANFMSYVNSGKYANVAFHRSLPGFVVQSGGFTGTGSGSNFNSVVTAPAVVNEPGLSNLRGTIAMAKLGGDPNSATSQFFINMNDNSTNLNFQNGGFTVFGRVAGSGMAVADAVNAMPRSTYNLLLNGGSTPVPFADFPMNATVAPPSMDQSKLVKILAVSPIPTLSLAVTANTRPEVAAATIVNGELRISGLRGGQTTLTVTATDLDLLSASQQVTVTLSDTLATWAARTSFPGGANGPLQDPDGDGLNNLLEYAFLGDPGVANRVEAPVMGTMAVTPAGQAMTIRFPVRKFASGLRYSVEASHTLTGPWVEIWNSALGFTHPLVVEVDEQDDRSVVTIRDNAALGAETKRFLRVRIVQG